MGRLGELGAAPSPSLCLGIMLRSGLNKAVFGSGAKAKFAFAPGGAAVLPPVPRVSRVLQTLDLPKKYCPNLPFLLH